MLMMMTANLVGFVVGTDGTKFFLTQLFGTWEGLRFMVVCCSCMFIGVQFMFEYRSEFFFSSRFLTMSCPNREEELRQGIVRRC